MTSESELYTNQYNRLIEQNHSLQTEIKQLKAENDRLKEELRTEKIYSSQIEELEEGLQHAKAENKELSESIKRLKNMAKAAALGREKYKQALQEIQEDLETQSYCECSECGNDEYDKCIECMTKRYLTKINEVIGAE